MFLGMSYTNTASATSQTLVVPNTVSILIIQNAIFDAAYTSANEDMTFTTELGWDFDTKMYAAFDGNLYGGSVNFTEEIVESIRIKKKTHRDNTFKTIYEKPVRENADLDIIYNDYYEPKGTVSFAYVPVISGAEGNYITSTIESDFDNAFLCGYDTSFPIVLNTTFKRTRPQNKNIVKPLGRETPIIISNGVSKYYTFSGSAMFIEPNKDDWDFKNAWDYKNRVYDFMTDGTPKIFKDVWGNLYMVDVTGNISEGEDNFLYHEDIMVNVMDTSFEMTQCGDAYDVGELYDNGFINSDVDR